MENLKDLVRNDLNEQKETERLKRVESNKNLKEITLYVNHKNSPQIEGFIKTFKEEGIKFKTINLFEEKNISLGKQIHSITQVAGAITIFISDNYLVFQRDFNSPQQAVNLIKLYADPEYVNPPLDLVIRETLKNMGKYLNNQLQNINRQIQPIAKVMNELAKEEAEEKKVNE